MTETRIITGAETEIGHNETESVNTPTQPVGRFAIANAGDLSAYLPVFANVFIVSAHFDQEQNLFLYTGLSGLFDHVPVDAQIPAYRFDLEPHEDGGIAVKAIRLPDQTQPSNDEA